MIIQPDQLTRIRVPGFSFSAGFLERMAIALNEFLQPDALAAAADKNLGRLTTGIADNFLLTREVIGGAQRLTTPEDQSRAGGIQRLTEALEALDRHCRELTGMSVETLLAFRAKPDLYDAEFLNRVVKGTVEYLGVFAALVAEGSASPGDERQQFNALECLIKDALASPICEDPAKAEALERLSALRDQLREMLP